MTSSRLGCAQPFSAPKAAGSIPSRSPDRLSQPGWSTMLDHRSGEKKEADRRRLPDISKFGGCKRQDSLS